jgi:hypothetical protein
VNGTRDMIKRAARLARQRRDARVAAIVRADLQALWFDETHLTRPMARGVRLHEAFAREFGS